MRGRPHPHGEILSFDAPHGAERVGGCGITPLTICSSVALGSNHAEIDCFKQSKREPSIGVLKEEHF